MDVIKKHSSLGKLSFILAIIVVIGIIIGFIVLFSLPSPAMFNPQPYDMIIFSFFIFLIVGIIAIVLGIIAFLGKQKDKLGLSAITIGAVSIFLDLLLFMMTLLKGIS